VDNCGIVHKGARIGRVLPGACYCQGRKAVPRTELIHRGSVGDGEARRATQTQVPHYKPEKNTQAAEENALSARVRTAPLWNSRESGNKEKEGTPSFRDEKKVKRQEKHGWGVSSIMSIREKEKVTSRSEAPGKDQTSRNICRRKQCRPLRGANRGSKCALSGAASRLLSRRKGEEGSKDTRKGGVIRNLFLDRDQLCSTGRTKRRKGLHGKDRRGIRQGL